MAAPREPGSLFGEILDWMLAPLLLLWPLSLLLTWPVAQNIAHRPYDRDLGEALRVLARQVSIETDPKDRLPNASLKLPAPLNELLRADDVDQVFFQLLGSRGEFVAGDTELPVPEEPPDPGGEVHFRDDTVHDTAVRVAYLWVALPGGAQPRGALVQMAETLEKRSRLATEIIKGVITAQFMILPLAVGLVWLGLSRGIRPLSRLQARLRRRDSGDLSPIDESDVPDEVTPLVRSINELLARLDQSMSQQKHFLADAAHQLKTPLAGLRMQAELAERTIDAGSGDAHSLKLSLQQIQISSQRAARMVNQLLAMARAEDREQALRQQPFSLTEVVTETVRDFVPRAMDKQIDLGYEGPADDEDRALMVGQPVLIRELVRNLVDNALQYTPRGGTVTVRVITDPFGQVVVLQVEDNGPGIPAAERELVFQPFYRVLGTQVDGSGLGLAIVREVAQHHGAELTVEDAQPRAAAGHGPGTLFTLRFAVGAAAGAPAETPPAAPSGPAPA